MTKKLSSLFIMVVTLLIMSSCLGTSEDKTTYYDDTAVTAFSLGTLNITRQTKTKDGLRDSTVKSTYKANSYHFNIDQVNRLIYNALWYRRCARACNNHKQEQWYHSFYAEKCQWKRQHCLL